MLRSHPETCDGIRLARMAFHCVIPLQRSAATTLRRHSLLKAILSSLGSSSEVSG